jgi:outer membrane protein assembly factor BamB
MTRPQRYLLISVLLILAGLVALSWQFFRLRFPNAFDRESEDAAEVEKLKAADFTAARVGGQPTPNTPVADWPQFLGPNRDGTAPADDFNPDWKAKPPKVLWTTPCSGGYSSCVVVGGRVYTQDLQDGNERILCLDAADGKPVWAYEYPADYSVFRMGYADGPRATPAVHDGRLYAVGALGKFLCLKLPTRPDEKPVLLWEHDLLTKYQAKLALWGYACSPLVEGDQVVVQPSGAGGAVAAFHLTTGEQKWAAGHSLLGYSSPTAATLGGVRQVVAVTGDSVVGVRVPDGKLLWEHPWKISPEVNAASPVIAGEYVYVSSDYGKGCTLLRVTAAGGGKAAAKAVYFRPGSRGMKNWHSTAVHRDGFVYGFDSRTFRCLDLRAGTLVEDYEGRDEANRPIAKGTVVRVGNQLVIQSETGGLYLADADPAEFKLRGQMTGVLSGSQCWATPTVVSGRLYTRDGEKVVCLDVRK